MSALSYLYVIIVLSLTFFSGNNAHAEKWEGNFRRCDVTKSFSQGYMRISVGETVDLDVVWTAESDIFDGEPTNISVRIDNRPLPYHKAPKPAITADAVYDLELGRLRFARVVAVLPPCPLAPL
jgi:hypothetical protein